MSRTARDAIAHPFPRSRASRRRGTWFVAALLMAAAILVVLGIRASTAGADAVIQTYPLPDGTAGTGLTTAPDGTVWFATGDGNIPQPRIGRLDPAAAQPGTSAGISLYPTPTFTGAPCCATIVRSLAYDPEGNVWFVRSDGMYGYGRVGDLRAGTDNGFSWGTVKYQNGANTAYIGLWGIAYDPTTKQVWLAENTTTNVASSPGQYAGARMAVTDKALGLSEGPNIALQGGRTTIDSLRYDAKPRGVSIGADGQAWFAESDPGNPGWRIARTNGTGDYTEYLIQPCVGTPCSGSYTGTGPTETTVAPDGSVWFTNELNRSIGRLDTVGGTFTTYTLASIAPALANGRPMQIRTAADGTLWVAVYGGISNPGANAIVRIVPSAATPTATVYSTGASAPLSVAPSSTGDVWFGMNPVSGTGAIGRLQGVLTGGSSGSSTPPASGTTTLTPSAVGVARPGTVTTSGDTTSITQICVGPPQDRCSLVYMVQSHEYVTGFPGSKANEYVTMATTPVKKPVKKPAKPKKAKKPPLPILAKVSVTLKGGQKKTTKIRLSPKARVALAKKGTIRATLIVQQRMKNGTLKTIQKKQVVFRAKKKPVKKPVTKPVKKSVKR